MKQNGIGRLGTVLAAFFTAFLVLAAQPAQAKGGDNYQEALTAVTTVADGFYKVQLTDPVEVFHKRLSGKHKQWRTVQETPQRIELDEVVNITTQPVVAHVDEKVYAGLHNGKIQSLEYLFQTDDEAIAQSLMKNAVTNLTALFGQPRNGAPSVQSFQTKTKQLQYRFTSFDWEQGDMHVQLNESYRNPALVKGPDGKPYRAYYISVRRWLMNPEALDELSAATAGNNGGGAEKTGGTDRRVLSTPTTRRSTSR